MAYHSGLYLFVFLPSVLFAYQIVSKKHRWKVLLLAGYLFFWLFSGKLLVYLLGATALSYGVGRGLEVLKEQAGTKGAKDRRKERALLTLGIVGLLGVLGYLKYYNFLAESVNRLAEHAGGNPLLPAKELLLPIGISFYTLQAIGYMADVYWGKIRAEHHLGKAALFLGFFPQIMEGPISMYGQTADALWAGEDLQETNLSEGFIRILWGLFKKVVIADRLYMVVTYVFDRYQEYSGAVIAAAAVAYTVQLYMEFSGCMDMVIGSARLFGVVLPENFRQPFASRNKAEFWRRWHMTLGTWLKTYVFFPVSVSKPVKKWNQFGRKHLGKYLTKLGVSAFALFPVWLCNGLWHGPRWSYIFFGMYYFGILMAGIAVEPLRDRIFALLRIDGEAWYVRRVQILKTWVIIFVGELFFRADGLKAGLRMFRSIFVDFGFRPFVDGTFLEMGLDLGDFYAIAAGCLIVGIVGAVRERDLTGGKRFTELHCWMRWAAFYGLIVALVMFGAYGTGYQKVDLIYAGF